MQALHDSLENFLLDDHPEVVSSALSFPPSVLKEVLGNDTLRKSLTLLLKRCIATANVKKWDTVLGTAVQVLCSLEIQEGPEEVDTLLALLPHFNKDNVVANILESPFAAQNKLLNRIKTRK